MLGIGPFVLLGCAVCQSGTSLSAKEAGLAKEDFKTFLASTWRCPSCGREWSFQEALIQGLTSRHLTTSVNLAGDILLYGTTTVFVGREIPVRLSQEVPLVLNVTLTPQGKVARLSWVPAGRNEFIVVSSTIATAPGQDTSRNAGIGEKLDVCWMLSGRSNWSDLNVPIWQIILIQAKEQLDRKGYALSTLSSVVALEALVDSLITEAFRDAGVDRRTSKRPPGIAKKISLLSNLTGISLKKSGLQRRFEDVNRLRDDVAHGEVAELSESQAREAFDVAVRAIFHLIIQSLDADAALSTKHLSQMLEGSNKQTLGRGVT